MIDEQELPIGDPHFDGLANRDPAMLRDLARLRDAVAACITAMTAAQSALDSFDRGTAHPMEYRDAVQAIRQAKRKASKSLNRLRDL